MGGFDLQEAGLKEINKKLTKNILVRTVTKSVGHLWQKAMWQFYDEFIKESTADMYGPMKNSWAKDQYNKEAKRMALNEGYIPEGAYTDSKFVNEINSEYYKKYLADKLVGKTTEEQHKIFLEHARDLQRRMYQRSPNTYLLSPDLDPNNSLITPERFEHVSGVFMLHAIRSEYLRKNGNDATRFGVLWDTHNAIIGTDLLQYSQQLGLGRKGADGKGEGFYIGMGKPMDRMSIDDTFQAILNGKLADGSALHDPTRYGADEYAKKLKGILENISKAKTPEALQPAMQELREFLKKDTSNLFVRVVTYDQIPKDGSELIPAKILDADGKTWIDNPAAKTHDGRDISGIISKKVAEKFGVNQGYGTKFEWQTMISQVARDMKIDNLQATLDTIENFRSNQNITKEVGRYVVDPLEKAERMNKFDYLPFAYGQAKGGYTKQDVGLAIKWIEQCYGLPVSMTARDFADVKGSRIARDENGNPRSEPIMSADGTREVGRRLVLEKPGNVGEERALSKTGVRFASIRDKKIEEMDIPDANYGVASIAFKTGAQIFHRGGLFGKSNMVTPGSMKLAPKSRRKKR